MAQKYMTPGVYIDKTNPFPNSVVEVATAIPAFIGYTQKAIRNGKALLDKPVRITSLKEYVELFGEGNRPNFDISAVSEDSNHRMTIEGKEWSLDYCDNNHHYLYNCIRLFYANGGNVCYIVSVGTINNDTGEVIIEKERLLAGLETLAKEQEPTMIVVPDAVQLGDNCYEVYKQVLAHCAKMQNRVAILDVYDGYRARVVSKVDVDIITKFREHIGTENLNYGAAYYPWLVTTIVQHDEVTFKNISASVDLYSLLPEKEAKQSMDDFPKNDAMFKTALKEEEPNKLELEIVESLPTYRKKKEHSLHLRLMGISPTYSKILDKLLEAMNLLPPSSAMAGIYTTVDNSRGVWKAPANIGLNSVIKPAVNITHDEQENLNVDAISGKSINAIRTFPGEGTLVWGGRTLDGNSLDWQYMNVRRTMIMFEQSIKLALRAYVFEPNNANTWVIVKGMIVNFLTEKWKQGALAGSSPEDAFDVQIGLGSTMTSLDILEGKMRVTIKLAIVRPAEFIVVTFEQQMQKS